MLQEWKLVEQDEVHEARGVLLVPSALSERVPLSVPLYPSSF
jgi:hypothetical protein